MNKSNINDVLGSDFEIVIKNDKDYSDAVRNISSGLNKVAKENPVVSMRIIKCLKKGIDELQIPIL